MNDYRNLKVRNFFNGTAREFVRNKILASDMNLKEGEFDAFGADLDVLTDTFTVLLFFYKFYFRVEVHGIENVPSEGPGLIVSNHAPILPIDAMMIGVSGVVEGENPRIGRAIVNKHISSIPYFSTWMSRAGQVIGCDENARRIFQEGKIMLVFPTGAEGDIHSIFNKYEVAEFPIGFMEYALRYRTPIIPTCVTGSEEAAMTLGKLDLPVGGFKHFPITPIFPWLGILGLVPFPSKINIYYGEPVDYFTDHGGEVNDPAKVRILVDDLREKIVAMLDEALGR
ncbi:MAG: 1-acyl-sn-glycerol-3-phosphate acyltransferase [bacterium]